MNGAWSGGRLWRRMLFGRAGTASEVGQLTDFERRDDVEGSRSYRCSTCRVARAPGVVIFASVIISQTFTTPPAAMISGSEKCEDTRCRYFQILA